MAYDIFIFVVLIILNLFQHINGNNEVRSCPDLECDCLGFNILCSKLSKPIPWKKFPIWIENLIIEDMPDLKKIRVSDMSPLPHLKHMNISRTSLEYVELGVLSKLPGLITLRITQSQLRVIPRFGLHAKLKQLILNGNHITAWSADALKELPNLQVLQLTNNNVTHLESRFFPHNYSLRHLHVQGNGLKHIATTLGTHHLPLLQVLKLQKNRLQLTILEETQHSPIDAIHFPSFPSVEQLDLSRNPIKLLRSLLFSNWSSLRVLKLRRCSIEEIRAGAFLRHSRGDGAAAANVDNRDDEPGLRELDLSANPQLRSVEAGWLFGLGQLRRLLLTKCGIRKLTPGAFEALQELLELDISENRHLRVLGSGSSGGALLFGLARLEVLKVNAAGLQHLEVSGLASLTSLRRLELRDNRLTMSDSIEGILEPLQQLRFLDLRNNLLSRLRGATLRGPVRLQSLDLRGNPIESVDPSALTALGNMFQLHDLHLDSTRLRCGASCLWRKFARWAVSRELKGLESANCSSGETLISLASRSAAPAAELLSQTQNASNDEGDCLVGLGPQMHLAPQSVSQVLVGANLTLQCAFRCHLRPLLWWEYSSVLLASDVKEELRTFGRLRLNTSRSTAWESQTLIAHESGVPIWLLYLRVVPIRLEDKGRYRCLAKNIHGQLASASAKVHVYVLPTFVSQPFVSMVVQAGTTVEIPCAATGVPQPQTSLRKADGSRFIAAKERRIQVMRGDRSFFIAAVTRDDAGTYVCQSESPAGRILSNFTLTVYEAPAFRSPGPPRRVRAFQNASALLACVVESLPSPSVQWSHEGRLLERNSTAWTFEHNDQVLRFDRLKKEHAGRYLCRLSNAAAAIEAVIDLQVDEFDPLHVINKSLAASDAVWTWTMTCAVVSAVVLGVVLTSLIWLSVILCLRRRRRKRKHEAAARRLFAREADSPLANDVPVAADTQSNIHLAQHQASTKPLLHSPSPATIDTAANARQLFLELSNSASLQLLTLPEISSPVALLSPAPHPMMYLNFNSEPSLTLVPPSSYFSYGVSPNTAANSTSDYHTASSRSDSGSDSYQQLLLLQQSSTLAMVVGAGDPVLEEDDCIGLELVT